jgi:hypothetical protein
MRNDDWESANVMCKEHVYKNKRILLTIPTLGATGISKYIETEDDLYIRLMLPVCSAERKKVVKIRNGRYVSTMEMFRIQSTNAQR